MFNFKHKSFWLVAVVFLTALPASAACINLRCEASVDPAGIDVPQPRLSWALTADPGARGVRQTAYEIFVASTSERLKGGQADLWDSGRVESDRLGAVAYGGRALTSGQLCYWTVRTWDSTGAPPTDAPPARWIMGLLTPDQWAPAKWIGGSADPASSDSILLRRTFAVKPSITRATMFVSGLGQYELSLNGRKVGDQLLSPGWTDYRKTVLYDTFDVTDQVRAGADNAVGLMLANGVYNLKATPGRYVKYTNSFGPLKAIAQLRIEYADGTNQTVVTDHDWTVLPSPITYSNVFGGEDYDARRLPARWDDAAFSTNAVARHAIELEGPGGILRGHSVSAPPIKKITTQLPVVQKELRPGVTVYDLGQNASHMATFTVHGPAGSFVRVIPSELVGPDGAVDRASCVQDAGGPAWWQYTLAGTTPAETYVPRFFYQGCRYLQVEREPAAAGGPLPTIDSIEGVVIHSSADPIGSFATSSTLFNRIYDLVRWAQRSNMMSVMTDCPQREKLGWLEQLHLNGPSLRYNFKLDNLYAKVMNDMADAQLPEGVVPNIAPEYFIAGSPSLDNGFRNSIEWGSSFILAAWQQYQFTGDPALLADHFPQMLKYLDSFNGALKDDIIQTGLGDWYDLGPNPPWGSQLTPPPFTATAIFYYDTCILAQAAELLGRPADAARLRERSTQIRAAFNRAFYDPQGNRYSTGSQCTSAMPLALGLVPAEGRASLLQTLIDDIRAHGNALTAGDVGYRFVLRALADAGRSDVVFDMNNQQDRPGYGMQLARGATSLTEKWDASVGNFGSQDHFMLGQINEWFFHDLAGIQCDPAGPGFEKIIIRPAPVGDLSAVRASYDSAHGLIVSEWKRDGVNLTLSATVPAGVTATIFVPAAKPEAVKESDRPLQDRSDVKLLRVEDGAAVVAVGSGAYVFTSTLTPAMPGGLSATTAAHLVTLTWTPVAGATGYTVTRKALEGNSTASATQSVVGTTYADREVKDGATYSYSVRAKVGQAESPAAVVNASPGMVHNASFESPRVAAEQYDPHEAGWSFTPEQGHNGSGVAANGGLFMANQPPAPAGRQVAFLQGQSQFGQTLDGLTPGEHYTIQFHAAQRVTFNTAGQTWDVLCGDRGVASFAPEQSRTNWEPYHASFTASGSREVLTFRGTNQHGGDNTVFIDDVRVMPADPASTTAPGHE